jgi:hypothetical protein
MTDTATPSAQNLSTPYAPVALYYEDADTLEYVRRDTAAVYRRVDEKLTLVHDMMNRDELIGFQIKGFRHYYLNSPTASGHRDFVSLVGILEGLLTTLGDAIFDREAYESARKMALEDRVDVRDLQRIFAR